MDVWELLTVASNAAQMKENLKNSNKNFILVQVESNRSNQINSADFGLVVVFDFSRVLAVLLVFLSLFLLLIIICISLRCL